MARAPRPQLAGGIYHVTTRGNRGSAIYSDDYDRRHFVTVLSRTVARYGLECLAWVLMTTHYHVLLRTPEPNISQAMQYLNGRYALDFNDRHHIQGHVFERRFRAVVVETQSQLLTVARYIVLNPVRAKLCDDPAEWKWGSFRAMIGLEEAPAFLTVPWLMDQFSVAGKCGAELFAEFVAAGV